MKNLFFLYFILPAVGTCIEMCFLKWLRGPTGMRNGQCTSRGDTHHQIGPDTGTTVSCHFVRGGEERGKKST